MLSGNTAPEVFESADDNLVGEFIELDQRWLEKILILEKLSFPFPWTRELFLGEFGKAISFRPAIAYKGELLAQSFNHIVADELHILNISVHPDFRSQGHGRRLLCYIMEEAKRRGASFSTLEVRTSNVVAQSMYARFGFRVVSVRHAYYVDNQEDALILERPL